MFWRLPQTDPSTQSAVAVRDLRPSSRDSSLAAFDDA